MLSIGLWRWYINTTITVLDINHRPIFDLERDVSETVFCLRLQVKPTQLGPIYRASLDSSEAEINFIYWAQLSRIYLKTKTESSLRNVVF
jgi:hypothetical protein